MQPFRDLLKKGVKFHWTSELQTAFEEAKEHIIELVKEGVRIFDMNKPTCLATDWCRQGVGFFLLQKHCSCQGPLTPTCCVGGWKLVFAGGKFNTPAESSTPLLKKIFIIGRTRRSHGYRRHVWLPLSKD